MKLKYLDRLAEIVVSVDEGKNITDANVVSLTDSGIKLVTQMKLMGLDIGALQETFAGMQLMCDNRVVLSELIEMAHEEIFRLLGNESWKIYGFDEGVLFNDQKNNHERSAAYSF